MMNNRPNREEMMAWVREFTKWPHRMTGTEEGKASASFVKETFKSLGLEDVQIEEIPSVCRDTSICTLNIADKAVDCLIANGTNRVSEIGMQDSIVEDAEVIYLNRGSEEDFENVDVTGKIVLCDVFFKEHTARNYMKFFDGAKAYDPDGKIDRELNIYNIFSANDWPWNYMRAKEKGAAGFVGILQNFMDCNYLHEDYTDIVDIDGYMSLPGLWVSKQDGEAIKADITAGETLKGSMHVKTEYEEKRALNVMGKLKGMSDDVLLIHSHHDATCRGGVQDASGMSVVFSLAKYFASLPVEERKTNMIFLSTDSHYTDYEGHDGFIRNRKADGTNIIMDFAIEHLGKEMEMDEDNQIILYDESAVRNLYVYDDGSLPEIAYELVEKYNLEKTMLLPVKHSAAGEYKSGDVNSDAYDFNANGIPVVSLIAAPMYIYHSSDDADKVHQDSLEPVANMFIELAGKVWENKAL